MISLRRLQIYLGTSLTY